MKKRLLTATLVALSGVAAMPALAAEMQVLPPKNLTCSLPLEKARLVVMDSALRFNWQVVEDKNGSMKLRYSKGYKFSVDIEVAYTQKSFRINYLESYGLGYEKHGDKAEIHRNYNRWIRNLDKEITLRSNAACMRK